jgi:hypothetical protein
MALGKIDLYEISDNKIYKLPYFKKNKRKTYVEINNIKRSIFNKKIFIICGEEIYIKKLNLPKVKGEVLEKLIKDELNFYYKGREDIIFTYLILVENPNNLDLVVFYIDSRRLRNIELKNIYNVRGIYLIQFIYIKYINKIVNFSNYLIAFVYEQNFYLIYCEHGVLKANFFQKEFKQTELELKKHILNFCGLNNIEKNSLKKIITSGFNFKISEDIKNEFKIMDVDFIEKANLYKAIR